MAKRGQGISLNVIIIAVIALVVLVVVIAIFTGRMHVAGLSLSSCAAKGGHCAGCELGDEGCSRSVQTKCEPGEATILHTDCNKDGVEGNDYCCIPVG